MAADRWARIEKLYHTARALPPEARLAYLDRECGSDRALRDEVASLLEHAPGSDAAEAVTEAPESGAAGQGVAPGTTISHYRIEARIGSGGMGQVFRGVDTRLNRGVAIKVSDAAFTERFRREAQVLASLSHPHICTLFDVGPDYLVMELVDGETLEQRLTRGPLPEPEVLRLGAQVAEALAHAHAKGITHRDLKPGNVMLTRQGVKLLDFGLASIGDRSLTQSGVVMGTPAYMAPEQYRGRDAGPQTDIYALGLVLYEMAVGQRPVVRPGEPANLAGLRPTLAHVVGRSLAEEPDARWQQASEIGALLEFGRTFDSGVTTPTDARRWRLPEGRRARVAVAGAVVTLLVVAAALGYGVATYTAKPGAATTGETYEVRVAIPSAPFTAQPARVQLSADGSKFVYPSVVGMAVGDTRGPDVAVLDVAAGANSMFPSPDGRWVAYIEKASLLKVPVAGGSPIRLAGGVDGSASGSWSADGFIVFAGPEGLYRVPEAGGPVEPVPVQLKTGERIVFPVLLPDGRHILCTVADSQSVLPMITASAESAHIELIDRVTGTRKVVVDRGSFPALLSTGHLVYRSKGGIYARPFDRERLEAGPDEVRVISDVAQFSVAANGTLLYVTALNGPPRTDVVWVDRRTGNEQSLGLDPVTAVYPRLSPDGRRVALDGMKGAQRDIFVWDIERRLLSNITNDRADNQIVAWLDDRRVVFGSRQFGPSNLFVKAIDSADDPVRVSVSPNQQMPTAVAPDGRVIVAELTPDRGFDLRALDLTSGRVENIVSTPFIEANPSVSPDGRRIAYQSNETGRFEVYVQSLGGAGPREKIPISSGGGMQPLWSRDGRELFYRDAYGSVMAVPVEPRFGQPTKVVEARDYAGKTLLTQGRSYDVAADGRFLMVKTQTQDLVLVVNWLERLKRALPLN